MPWPAASRLLLATHRLAGLQGPQQQQQQALTAQLLRCLRPLHWQQHWQQQPLAAPPPPLARGMAVVVDVQRNNVDRAYAQLNKHFRDSGMVQELRKREYRKTTAELKFDRNRASHNKRMGALIAERLKWVVRRRKLKM